MKALISVDMEGISGIVHSSETNPERYDYPRGRELMTAEANAVIAGVLDAEPTAEVLVADAHGTFRNLLPERLDRRARLVRGKPRALNMLAGLDGETDAALFVGYHVRAGEGPGVLAHTMNGEILDVRQRRPHRATTRGRAAQWAKPYGRPSDPWARSDSTRPWPATTAYRSSCSAATTRPAPRRQTCSRGPSPFRSRRPWAWRPP
ncbi:hypothetical protein SCALM49S_07970 [Streptomyces californicus]